MEKTVFRNAPIAVLWLFGIILGLVIVFLAEKARYDVFGWAIFGYSAYAAIMHYLGVVVAGNSVWFPLPLIPMFPFLVIGRAHIEIGQIGYIKSFGSWFGFEAVDIRTMRDWRILFSNRDKRLAFFEALNAVRSDLMVYRRRR